MMAETPFMDYIAGWNATGSVSIKDLRDMKGFIKYLEDFTLFEKANKMRAWYQALSDCVAAEFDEDCLGYEIPLLPPYELEEELEFDGWLHEWELPFNYEEQ